MAHSVKPNVAAKKKQYHSSLFHMRDVRDFLKQRRSGRIPPQSKLTLVHNNYNEMFVHKEVLAARCEYFRAMIEYAQPGSNKITVIFKDVTFRSIKIVIDYLYTGKVTLTGRNVFEIYEISDYLLLTELNRFCKIFLTKAISCESLHVIDAFARSRSEPEICRAVQEFCTLNFEEFINHASTAKWSRELMLQVISSAELEVTSEAKVAQLIWNWLTGNLDMGADNFDAFEVNVRKGSDLFRNLRLAFTNSDEVFDVLPLSGFKFRLLVDIWKADLSPSFERQSNMQPPESRRKYQAGVYMMMGKIGGRVDGETEFIRYWPLDSTTTRHKFARWFHHPFKITQLTQMNGKIGVIGHARLESGSDTPDYQLWDQPCNRAVAYDPIKRIWRVRFDWRWRTSRYLTRLCDACPFDENVYLFGQRCAANRGMRTCEVFLPQANVWKKLPRRLNRKCQTAAARINDSIYLVSPGKLFGRKTYKVDRFIPQSNKLFKIPSNFSLRGRTESSPRVVAFKSKLFIFKANRRVIIYDTEVRRFYENFFMEKPKMFPNHVPVKTLFVFHDKIYVNYKRDMELGLDGTYKHRLAVLDPTVLDGLPRRHVQRNMKRMFHHFTYITSKCSAIIGAVVL